MQLQSSLYCNLVTRSELDMSFYNQSKLTINYMINSKLCLLSSMVFTIDMLKISHHPSASASSTGRSMRHVEVDGHRLTDFDVKVYQACYQIPIGKGRR